MNFSVDKTKEAQAEIDHYHQSALAALLLENISLAQEWYLAANTAAHFLRRKTSCEQLGTPPSPLIHQVATLMLSTQEQQKHFSKLLIEFEKKSTEALDVYYYWIACSQALSSSNSTQLFSHLEPIQDQCAKTFSAAVPFLQEAERYFKRVHHSEVLPEQQLFDYHWSALLYDAFFFATLQKPTPLAFEILLARRRVISAMEAQHQQRARLWSLIAFAKENIVTEDTQLEINLLEKQLLCSNPAEAWQRALCWLLAAHQAKQKAANNQTAIKQVNFISKKWQRISAIEMKVKSNQRFSFFSKFLFHCATLFAHQRERRYHSLIKVMLLHEVTFCLPAQCIPNKEQQEQQTRGLILPELEYNVFYNWIYQTWYHLTQAGISCKLSNQLSNEGIIVTLGGTLPLPFGKKTLSKNLFLVDVLADNTPFSYATLHIIQNKKKAQQTKHALYVPHWPQPHLIPRNSERKHRFENICFFGHDKNLAPELQTHRWQERLKKELGLHFKIKRLEEWHDYSDVDCVIAIRDFSQEPHLNKPGTKLYNAWLAGVPFIGGSDSAYRADGHPGKDYLVATSLEEAFQHLQRLKEDEAFRMKLVNAGKKSSTHFTQQAILERWKKLVLETIPFLAIKRLQESNE